MDEISRRLMMVSLLYRRLSDEPSCMATLRGVGGDYLGRDSRAVYLFLMRRRGHTVHEGFRYGLGRAADLHVYHVHPSALPLQQ